MFVLVVVFCLFVLLVFVFACGCGVVACACVRVRVCVGVLFGRVFDDVGHALCCVWWVDACPVVWRMVCGVSDTAPVCGVILRG